ncbi:MAG: ATP-dependent zinc metalloprotease FtsH [Pseudomonadales bacterium]|nr:ATP-dependent zinc metalloprotease FtsH [Pseudomonadales bacterium]
MEKKHQLNVGYLFVAIWAILLFQTLFGPASRQADISYRQFQDYLEQGQVKQLAIDERYIRGEFTEAIDGKTHFITPRLEIELAEQLARYKVDYTGVVQNTFLATLLSWLAPAFIFLLVWFFVFRRFAEKQGMGGMMNIGKSRAKVLVEKNTGVSLDDVAGVDEAKDELVEVVQFLKEPEHYRRLGAHIPKGILLVGPPGTGKTLLARAVAGEAGVPFFSISGSEFIEMFVGVGAARVRDLFEQAKKQAPAIIFIDELDALGRARGIASLGGGNDEREQTLNQLLTEMDGFNPADGVIILAATNRPEILDPALLRAGRFDRQVLVDRPDKPGREQILRVHVKKIQIDAGVDLATIAALTTGFSGADLANLVNEAAIVAIRRNAEKVSLDDFVSAIERIVAGLAKKNRLINPNEKNIVAHHEMGHALVGMLLNPGQPIQKVSIIPRGVGALGYTIQRPSEDRFLVGRQELKDRIAMLLAGRAAEKLIFDEITTGAADDLVKATDIARAMVTRYGMSDDIGLLSLEPQQPQYLELKNTENGAGLGPDMAQRVTAALSAFLDEAFTRAFAVLGHNEKLLRESAQLLVEKETLSEEQLRPFKERLRLPD